MAVRPGKPFEEMRSEELDAFTMMVVDALFAQKGTILG
jgi:hypothetical protein